MDNFDNYIAALKEKNEEAFEYIYHTTKTSVFSIILSIIKDRSLSEDVMQETYIKMLSSINKYKIGTNFRNWLLTIARNTALDYYRKRKNDIVIDVTESEYLLPSEEPKAMKQLEAEELLNILSIEEREIVMLRIVDDIKHKDIAQIVNKPLGTVLWIYNKAIKKMKNHKGGK